MSNPLYDMYGHVNNDFMNRFQKFRSTFRQDPRQVIQNMLDSGRITQEQLNAAMKQAEQLMRFMK